jgi:preprotein translocase subunit SecG
MTTFSVFLVLITIVCFLLIIVIMVQNPKGGGLSSSIGGSQMLGGVQKTTDFLDKSTWTLSAILFILILLSSLSFTGSLSDQNKILQDIETAPATQTTSPVVPSATEAAPATTAPAAATEPAPVTETK